MQVRIIERITDIAVEPWNALLGPGACPLVEHGYLAALERSGAVERERFEPRHVTLWSGDALVAALPCYLKHGDRGDVMQDWAATVASKHELPYGPTLFVGVPFTGANTPKLLTAPGVDRIDAVARLVAAAKELTASAPSPVIHLYLTTHDEVALLEPHGFHARLTPRYLWRNQGYRAFADFTARLRSKRRAVVRLERTRIAEAGIRVRTLRGSELTADVIELMARCHRNTIDKHGPEADFYPPAFFQLAVDHLPSRVEIALAERDGIPIAAAFNLASDRVLYTRTWGALEPVPLLHFEVAWYHGIEQAIARGLEAVDPGGPGVHKLLRGFVANEPHYSASWIGDAELDEVFARYLVKEREWLARHFEELRERSPMLATPGE